MRSRRLLAVVVALAGAVAGGFATAGPAQAATAPAPVTASSAGQPGLAGAAFEIVNRGTGKCADVAGKSLLNGALVHQWSCARGANQLWIAQPVQSAPGYYSLINVNSGKCMDLRANNDDEVFNGTLVQQFECNAELYTSERWKLSFSPSAPGYLTFTTWIKGLCLDLNNGSGSNGARIQVWDCVGPIDNQLWAQR
ncbi:RICIN domain-containing protein [Longispora urticae]